MPETVEQFRRSFDAAGWEPERDLPVDEKKHRTREASYGNDHERDALAAALYAFDHHESQFERIAEKVPPRHEVGPVVARVVAGEESVESVLRDIEGEDDPEEDATEHQPRELTDDEQEIKRLEARIDRLESHVDDLKDTIQRKDDELAEKDRQLEKARQEGRREVRKDREVTRLERRNEALERKVEAEQEKREELAEKLERLKSLWKIDHSNFADVSEKQEGLVPVKVVPQFTRDAIDEADEQFGLVEDDIVLFRDASGAGRSTAQRLADIDPCLVLRNGNLSDAADEVLFDNDIPVAPAEMVPVQEVDELAVAREQAVEAAIEDWHDRAEKRRQEQKAEMVDQIISEHRADRPTSEN